MAIPEKLARDWVHLAHVGSELSAAAAAVVALYHERDAKLVEVSETYEAKISAAEDELAAWRKIERDTENARGGRIRIPDVKPGDVEPLPPKLQALLDVVPAYPEKVKVGDVIRWFWESENEGDAMPEGEALRQFKARAQDLIQRLKEVKALESVGHGVIRQRRPGSKA